MNQIDIIMTNSTIRQVFGTRVKELRKSKKWSQKELAKKVETSFQQINKYEGGINTPPLEKLILLAEALDTTIDYLITGDVIDKNLQLRNTRLLHRFQILEEFDSDDQEIIIKIIDAVIVKRRVESAMHPV